MAVSEASGAPSLWKNFPLPLVQPNNGLPDVVVTERLAGIVGMAAPDAKRIVVLDDQPQLAYAAARTGRTLPVQGFNLRQSYRRLRADLREAENRRDAHRVGLPRVVLGGVQRAPAARSPRKALPCTCDTPLVSISARTFSEVTPPPARISMRPAA